MPALIKTSKQLHGTQGISQIINNNNRSICKMLCIRVIKPAQIIEMCYKGN